MPPTWKIARELKRLKDRGVRPYERLAEVVQRRIHDRRFDQRLRIVDGSLPAGSKIAVFVLFQPNGVAPSVELTCRYLLKNGYTPMIVSNAPLSDRDLVTLQAVAWRVVIRPNFGNDFGAYRDGIFLVWRAGLDPDALILMNDSTWFPLRADDRALARIDAMEAPFAGFAYKQETTSRLGGWHVESHFLRFRREALEAPQFRAFWSSYQMSSDRFRTIQTGEKGITQAMMDAGFHPQSFVCFASFIAWFVAAPSQTQRRVLEEATYHIPARLHAIRQLVNDYSDTSDWRLRAIAQVNDMLGCYEFFPTTTFVATAMTVFGVPFLKKSSDDYYRSLKFGSDRFDLARRKVLDLHDRGEIAPLDPVVEAEIRAAVQKRAARLPAPQAFELTQARRVA